MCVRSQHRKQTYAEPKMWPLGADLNYHLKSAPKPKTKESLTGN